MNEFKSVSMDEAEFLFPNNSLNIYAFMHEKLPKYAHQFIQNI
jgi:hypothetical protein